MEAQEHSADLKALLRTAAAHSIQMAWDQFNPAAPEYSDMVLTQAKLHFFNMFDGRHKWPENQELE